MFWVRGSLRAPRIFKKVTVKKRDLVLVANCVIIPSINHNEQKAT